MGVGMEIEVLERPLTDEPRETPAKAPLLLSYLSTAEIAECNCPEPCERDHDRD
jgi:hypothetical protein